jgi:hypothetical protein
VQQLRYPDCLPAALTDSSPPATVNDNMAQISLMFGVGASDSLQYFTAESGFDPSNPACQQHILDICTRLRVDAITLGVQSKVDCWAEDFATWARKVDGGGGQFPVPANQFMPKLLHWSRTEGGELLQKHRGLGFERDKALGGAPTRLAWFQIKIYALDLPRYAAGFRALPLFLTLERLMSLSVNRREDDTGGGWVASAPSSLAEKVTSSGLAGLPLAPSCMSAPAFQTSELWPRMFTEVSAVQGTIWAIVIIGFSAFLTV